MTEKNTELMLDADADLWRRTHNYDLEGNRKAMEHNISCNLDEGVDPYYCLKWNRATQEAEEGPK